MNIYMLQNTLNNYFATKWNSHFDDFQSSGIGLAGKIKLEDSVLDVGCGTNPFKNTIKNLVGIDPVFAQADVQTTIENFQSDKKFNVALCLDSLIFGDKENVLYQIDCLVKHLTPNAVIHWRSNTVVDIIGYKKSNIPIFNWSQTDYVEFAEKFGFRIFFMNHDSHNSVHVIWSRSA